MEIKGINPENKKQARVFYDLLSAVYEDKEVRHPLIVMRLLEVQYEFKIIGKIPQTLFDGWDFWIEAENIEQVLSQLPKYIKNVPWKGVNEA